MVRSMGWLLRLRCHPVSAKTRACRPTDSFWNESEREPKILPARPGLNELQGLARCPSVPVSACLDDQPSCRIHLHGDDGADIRVAPSAKRPDPRRPSPAAV